ncbi:hypothetical protein [Roseobacter fucihabitans]|nr:hypothetical protein [Roseobacter litoralis]
MDDQTFDFVFCKQTSAMVSQGAFQCLGERFYSDQIAQLGHGERLEIRVPLRSSAEGVAVVRNRDMLGYAYPRRCKSAARAARHLREHRPGRPSKIDSDPELHAFINARIETTTFPALEKAVAKKFPPKRRVGKNAIHQ